MKITVLVLGIYMFTIGCYFQRNVTTCSIDRKAAAFRCLLAKTPNDSLNYKQTIPARDDVFHCLQLRERPRVCVGDQSGLAGVSSARKSRYHFDIDMEGLVQLSRRQLP